MACTETKRVCSWSVVGDLIVMMCSLVDCSAALVVFLRRCYFRAGVTRCHYAVVLEAM